MPELISSPITMPAGAVESRPVATTLSSRLPSLDGWRAFSIMIVLGWHTVHASGFPQQQEKLFGSLFDGHLGVRFFFVISGFLITWLMLLEQRKTGTVNLRSFYIRRTLRILPVYGAFLLVLALLQTFTPFHQNSLAWIGNITFTTNFLNDGHTTSHLWSLAVEEQFYLLWPAIFVFFKPQEKWGRMLGLFALTLVVAVANRFIWSQASNSPVLQALFSEWSFFNNVDSLCLGCVLAVLLMRQQAEVRGLLLRKPLLTMAAGLFLILCPNLINWVLNQHLLPALPAKALWAVHFLLGRTLQSVGFAVLLVQSILAPGWGAYRLLNNSAVCQLGVLSYSMYIWQQLFCTKEEVFGLSNVWWMSHPFWLLPAAAVALVSYYGFERPLLQLRHRFR
ncbi:MAG: acyltransferase family protein [Prosthecobacter sp.]